MALRQGDMPETAPPGRPRHGSAPGLPPPPPPPPLSSSSSLTVSSHGPFGLADIVLKEGFLLKPSWSLSPAEQRAHPQHKKRFFRLFLSGKFEKFNSEVDALGTDGKGRNRKRPIRTIDLDPASVRVRSSTRLGLVAPGTAGDAVGMVYVVEIVTPKRMFDYVAENNTRCLEWIVAFEHAIAFRRQQEEDLSSSSSSPRAVGVAAFSSSSPLSSSSSSSLSSSSSSSSSSAAAAATTASASASHLGLRAMLDSASDPSEQKMLHLLLLLNTLEPMPVSLSLVPGVADPNRVLSIGAGALERSKLLDDLLDVQKEILRRGYLAFCTEQQRRKAPMGSSMDPRTLFVSGPAVVPDSSSVGSLDDVVCQVLKKFTLTSAHADAAYVALLLETESQLQKLKETLALVESDIFLEILEQRMSFPLVHNVFSSTDLFVQFRDKVLRMDSRILPVCLMMDQIHVQRRLERSRLDQMKEETIFRELLQQVRQQVSLISLELRTLDQKIPAMDHNTSMFEHHLAALASDLWVQRLRKQSSLLQLYREALDAVAAEFLGENNAKEALQAMGVSDFISLLVNRVFYHDGAVMMRTMLTDLEDQRHKLDAFSEQYRKVSRFFNSPGDTSITLAPGSSFEVCRILSAVESERRSWCLMIVQRILGRNEGSEAKYVLQFMSAVHGLVRMSLSTRQQVMAAVADGGNSNSNSSSVGECHRLSCVRGIWGALSDGVAADAAASLEDMALPLFSEIHAEADPVVVLSSLSDALPSSPGHFISTAFAEATSIGAFFQDFVEELSDHIFRTYRKLLDDGGVVLDDVREAAEDWLVVRLGGVKSMLSLSDQFSSSVMKELSTPSQCRSCTDQPTAAAAVVPDRGAFFLLQRACRRIFDEDQMRCESTAADLRPLLAHLQNVMGAALPSQKLVMLDRTCEEVMRLVSTQLKRRSQNAAAAASAAAVGDAASYSPGADDFIPHLVRLVAFGGSRPGKEGIDLVELQENLRFVREFANLGQSSTGRESYHLTSVEAACSYIAAEAEEDMHMRSCSCTRPEED